MKFLIIVFLVVLNFNIVLGEDEFKYDSKGKRDPFIPLISKEGAYLSDIGSVKDIKDIKLEGIVWDKGENSVAIINGDIIREGEVVGNLNVLRIEEKKVIFVRDGEELAVPLMDDDKYEEKMK